jgi:hypothetical protein
MRRMVACPSEDGNEGTECSKADRPVDRIACNVEPCPAWNTGGWSEVGIPVADFKLYSLFFSFNGIP